MSLPRLLAVDAATSVVHVGLQAQGRIWTRELPSGAAASAQLLPAVQALLAEAGLRCADLDAIAFGRGPGAFTGLRTAAAVAQGLALGSGRPVIALDTLMTVAEDARLAAGGEGGAGPAPVGPRRCWAVIDARMGELYAAAWHWDGADWRADEPPALWQPPALAAALLRDAAPAHPGEPSARPPALLVAGNGLLAHPDAFAALPPAVQRHPDAQPGAAALLSLATRAWAAGQQADAALALPLYVRDKVAETTAERAARAAA